MAMGKRWLLGCAALLLRSPVALAEPPSSGVRLSYVRVVPGTERCPNEQGFRDLVAAQMGEVDPFTSDGARELIVSFARKGRSFQGKLVLVDGAGTSTGVRELLGATCGAVAEDAALSVSIALRAFARPSPPAAPGPRPSSPAPSPAAA